MLAYFFKPRSVTNENRKQLNNYIRNAIQNYFPGFHAFFLKYGFAKV